MQSRKHLIQQISEQIRPDPEAANQTAETPERTNAELGAKAEPKSLNVAEKPSDLLVLEADNCNNDAHMKCRLMVP